MAITDLIAIPGGINEGLNSARRLTMLALLGNPRGSYDQSCRPVTNANLKRLIAVGDVGPFRVTGLAPAVESLRAVMADIRTAEPEIFAALGSSGMLCARFQRGSRSAISNHSWGTAIDLNLNGQLDAPGNNRVQAGLARIAPIFHRHGWYWGAAFRREDAMHFEVSEQVIRRWHAEGVFRGSPDTIPPTSLSLGDRGRLVVRLQERLNELQDADIDVDGIFGAGTHAAVTAFQAANGLTPDGVVGPKTMRALGL